MGPRSARLLQCLVCGAAFACTRLSSLDAGVTTDGGSAIATRTDGIASEAVDRSAAAGEIGGVGETAGAGTNGVDGGAGTAAAALPCPQPLSELCDALDNDCDGRIDEALTRACGAPMIGECHPGTETCSLGAWLPCTGMIGPRLEACEAERRDENCDGSSNEGCACEPGQTQACGAGICKGMQSCEAGQWSMTCSGAKQPGLELCDAAQLDEDCDGMSNEGCACVDGVMETCPGANVGICKPGTRTCNAGKWSACLGLVAPVAESCDGVDNDCDGTIDDGAPCSGGARCAAGRCVQCTTDSECLRMNSACSEATCDRERGVCQVRYLADRTRCSGGICRAGQCFDGCIATADCPSSDQVCQNSRCVTVPRCGNARLESGEQCENGSLSESCLSLGYDGGSLYCTNCRYDLSQCYTVATSPVAGSSG